MDIDINTLTNNSLSNSLIPRACVDIIRSVMSLTLECVDPSSFIVSHS